MSVTAAVALDTRATSRILRALGDETRLRIVALLAHGELCVCHLVAVLGISQPNASRQLGILRTSGVVVARRAGSWVHYRLAEQADPVAARLLASLVEGYAGHAALRREVARVQKSVGPDACK